jgi:hypothetical protein
MPLLPSVNPFHVVLELNRESLPNEEKEFQIGRPFPPAFRHPRLSL